MEWTDTSHKEGMRMLQEIAASNAVALPMDLAQGRQQASIPMTAWWSTADVVLHHATIGWIPAVVFRVHLQTHGSARLRVPVTYVHSSSESIRCVLEGD